MCLVLCATLVCRPNGAIGGSGVTRQPRRIVQVVYTHQKRKKRPSWRDGQLVVSATGSRATLYDDSGRELEVLYRLTTPV